MKQPVENETSWSGDEGASDPLTLERLVEAMEKLPKPVNPFAALAAKHGHADFHGVRMLIPGSLFEPSADFIESVSVPENVRFWNLDQIMIIEDAKFAALRAEATRRGESTSFYDAVDAAWKRSSWTPSVKPSGVMGRLMNEC